LRKLALFGATLSALVVMVAVALAVPPTITVTGQITPTDAGTSKKPKNALVNIVFNVNKESESTLSGIEYTIPNGVKLTGKGFKTCSADEINANGDGGCPANSKIGTGAATATLGKNPGAPLNFAVNIYVAGDNALTLYLKTNLFNIAIPATISGQTVKFDIPERVQNPTGGASGPYSYVTSVTANLGVQDGIPASTKVKQKYKKTIKKHGKKKKVTRTRTVTKYFASSVSCPSGGYVIGVKGFLADNDSPKQTDSIEGTATAPCS
jgi:hypothetical protein